MKPAQRCSSGWRSGVIVVI
eukprot:IDg16141t1